MPHYQRLEFLGDAVLQLAVSRYLYEHSPEPEGRLSRARAKLVCEEALARAARRYGVGAYLILSPGQEKTGGRDRESNLADVMEALFAAVYLDGGCDLPAPAGQVLGYFSMDHMETMCGPSKISPAARIRSTAARTAASCPSGSILQHRPQPAWTLGGRGISRPEMPFARQKSSISMACS